MSKISSISSYRQDVNTWTGKQSGGHRGSTVSHPGRARDKPASGDLGHRTPDLWAAMRME